MQRVAVAVLAASMLASPSGPALAGESGPDPWFARDKALHFGATFVLASGAYGVTAVTTGQETPRPRLCAIVGASLAMTAGVAKEGLDLAGPGDASWRDLTWDVVGTATGVAVAWLLHRYVFTKK